MREKAYRTKRLESLSRRDYRDALCSAEHLPAVDPDTAASVGP
jgi:hypothetical protein